MKLYITLKSDLCAASGDGFSSAIDTDVAYDKFGLPLIPGRRIKGALRNVAKQVLDLDSQTINEIFGVCGNNRSGSLKISNAFVEDYEQAVEYLNSNYMEPQRVLDLFTYTRAQTAMDNGVAKTGSLRFTRVVSHYLNGRETQFIADVSVDDEYKDTLANICKGLRNIGFNKNRGFGSVKCELKDEKCEGFKLNSQFEEDKMYILNYTVHLKTPVMIPLNASDNSGDYITGSSVMGYFASKLNSDKALFDEMFLSNNIKFTNLYPVSNNGGKCIPAPMIIGKDKLAATKEKTYLSILDLEAQGKVIKPLKNGFVDSNYTPYATDIEVVYHNAKSNDKGLYTLKCIAANQNFYGSIIAKGEYMTKLCEVMSSGPMSLGSSKTAQYSVCEIIDAKASEYKVPKLSANIGDTLVYILKSDLILNNSYASSNAMIDDIKNELGIHGELDEKTAISYTRIAGYNAKWNQKKPHERAFQKGSAIVFKANKQEYDKCLFIGEKQEEGFGEIELYKPEEIIPKFVESSTQEVKLAKDNFLYKLIDENEKDEKLKKMALDFVLSNSNDIRVKLSTTSYIGRAIRMVSQASSVEDLNNKFESVKTQQKKDCSQGILKQAMSNNNIISEKDILEYMLYVFTYARYILKQKGGNK